MSKYPDAEFNIGDFVFVLPTNSDGPQYGTVESITPNVLTTGGKYVYEVSAGIFRYASCLRKACEPTGSDFGAGQYDEIMECQNAHQVQGS